MGNNDLLSLLDQKNAQIERLNAELLAYSARTSNLQTRLLQTFDVLDETQRTRAHELEEIEHKCTRLERRFHRHTAILNASEAETNELKDSVLELVEKIEQSNDIRSWPVNRLQLTRFIEHRHQPEGVVQQPVNDKLAYAGAIIDRLRQERDNEREAHARACKALQSKIDLLVTQLARRDTELEYYTTHITHVPTSLPRRDDGDNISPSSSRRRQYWSKAKIPAPPSQIEQERRSAVVTPIPLQRLTDEEIINMLNATAARNRSLEVEIKTLFKQLERARWKSSLSAPSPALNTRSRLLHQPSNTHPSTSKRGFVAGSTLEKMARSPFRERVEWEGEGRMGHAQGYHSRSQQALLSKGPSLGVSQEQIGTPSGQISYGVSRSNRPSLEGGDLRMGNAIDEGDGLFNRVQHQNMGSPIRRRRSAPVSEDSIGDGKPAHHENDDVIKVHVLAGSTSPPLAWDDTSYGFMNMGGSDVELPPHGASTRGSAGFPKSATIAELDIQIQDLAAQIDVFRRERDILLKSVASLKQHRRRKQNKEQDPGSTSSPDSGGVSRIGDDRSDDRHPAAVAEEIASTIGGHGDDLGEDSPMEVAREGAADNFAHRLSAVEDNCLRLRHELDEHLSAAEARENELLDELRLLQERVEELGLQCRVQQSRPHESPIEIPSSSHDYRRGVSQLHNTDEQEDRRQQPQTASFSTFDATPELAPDTTAEQNGLNISTPSAIEQTLFQAEVSRPSPGQVQFPWLQLNDSELDGLMDAIDGEAPMELATPLMPTSLLDRNGEDSGVLFDFDLQHQHRDQESDLNRDHSELLMTWDELEEQEIDHTCSGSGFDQGDEDNGGSASVGGSRSRSPPESTVYSGDVGVRERRVEQYFAPDGSGQRGGVMRGDGNDYNDFSEEHFRAQLEQGVEGQRWSDDDYGVHHDEPHYMYGREDPQGTRYSQQEQEEEVRGVNIMKSLPRNTRFEGLGLVFTFPHRPTSPSTTAHPTIRSRSRSPTSDSASDLSPATTEQLRLELEKAEQELTVAQEMLEQGEDALRDVEATIRMNSFSPPSAT